MRRLRSVWVVFLLVASACGSSNGDDTTGAQDAGDEAAPTTTIAEPATTAASSSPGTAGEGLTATPGPGWVSTLVGEGIKPVLALDSSDSPAIAYLEERLGDGFVAYAAASEEWAVDSFVEGYFYGPIGLAFDADDRPNVVWHDHQADTFQDALGDLAYGVRDGGTWTVGPAEDDGHDGWDSTVVIGDDGVVRAAGIDPAQFNRQDGVEYYELEGDTWVVEAIGSGPVFYEFNVGLAVGPGGVPVISYYDNNTLSLMFGRKTGGTWEVSVVDGEVDSGKYSDIEVDADGLAHISYLHQTTSTTGVVSYAVEDGSGGWVIEDVGEINDIVTGFTGARRATALELDADGNPHIAFTDRSGIWHASRSNGAWDVEQILTAGDLQLGQLVTFELATDGAPHLAYFEVTSENPLQGLVAYLATS